MRIGRWTHARNRVCTSARGERGQAVIEFALILPLFLGVLFTVFTFIMLMALSQMTFYTTFMAARAASVEGNYTAAAEKLMPRIKMASPKYEGSAVTMKGTYEMMPYLTEGGGALASPLRAYLILTSRVTLHKWPNCKSAGNEGDNKIACP